MYEELIMRLLEDKSWIEQGTTETEHEVVNHLQKAADAIDNLVKICNSILSKYKEAAESVICEYSGNINEDIDELYKEIEDYKAQINGERLTVRQNRRRRKHDTDKTTARRRAALWIQNIRLFLVIL